MKKSNKSILIVSYSFVVILFMIIINYVYFLLFKADSIVNNTYNKRSDVIEKRVLRGNIYSADFEVLATTIENEDGTVSRFYPFGNMYAHVVGRYDKGKTGVELSHNFELLKVDKYDTQTLKNEISGVRTKGYNVVTTLDSKLQEVAYKSLAGENGAVIVLEPSTGKILAMVSEPSYDPNTIFDDWESLSDENDENSALLNRAINGLYPPGSTFKVVMAMEYIIENKEYDKYSFKCTGTTKYETDNISCHNKKKHGNVNLYKSLAYSCNTSFANIGMSVNWDCLRELCEKLGFNTPLDFESYKIITGSFECSSTIGLGEQIQTSIGQGKTTISPMQNALIMCAVANKGEIMEPYVADYLCDENGNIVEEYNERNSVKVIDETVAQAVIDNLKGVTSIGTAKTLKNIDCEIYGKTGSAQYDSTDNAHAWFVGCASPEDKESIVVAVLVENGKTGSKSAVPIAKKIIEAYITQ